MPGILAGLGSALLLWSVYGWLSTHLVAFLERCTPEWLVRWSVAALVVALAARVAFVRSGLIDPARRLAARAAQGRGTLLTGPGLPPVALGMVVGAGTVALAALSRSKTGAFVLGDELLYVDLAKSMARTGVPMLRGELDIGHSLGLPAVASIAYHLSSEGSGAYRAIQAGNALAFSLVALPAYVFARRILDRGWGVAIAMLSVVSPWLTYPAYTMTESLFYPILVAFAVALAAALDAPTVRRQAVVLGVVVAAVAVRPQALALVLAVLLAVVALGVRARRLGETLRQFRPTGVVVIGALGTGLVLALAGVPVPSSGYGPLFREVSALWSVPAWGLRTVGIYSVSLAVVPVIVFPVALAALCSRGSSPREAATGIAGSATTLAILISVAFLSASPYGLDILHERSLFFVTPLVLTVGIGWLRGGARTSYLVWVGIAVVVASAVTLVASDVILRTNPVDSPTTAFLRRFDGLYGLDVRVWVGVIVAFGIAVLFVSRSRALPTVGIVLVTLAIVASVVPSGPVAPQHLRALSWIDRALEPGASATLLHPDIPRPDVPCAEAAEYEQQGALVLAEYFNASVDDLVHVYGTRGRDNLPGRLLEVGDDGTLLDGGSPLSPTYVATDSRQALLGTAVARLDFDTAGGSEGASLTLWRIDPPLRLGRAASPFPPRGDGSGC